jgi:hypothetical protein
MYFIRILLEHPFFSVSFPSAVISDIISTCGRSGDSATKDTLGRSFVLIDNRIVPEAGSADGNYLFSLLPLR